MGFFLFFLKLKALRGIRNNLSILSFFCPNAIFLFFFFILLCAIPMDAQNEADTRYNLRNRLARTSDLRQKVTLGNLLVREWLEVNLDSAIYYAEQTAENATIVDSLEQASRSYIYIGLSYMKKINYPKSYSALLKAKVYAQKAKSPRLEAFAYRNISDLYFYLGNYEYSIKHAITCYRLADSIKAHHIAAPAAAFIGLCYSEMGQLESAVPWLDKSLRVATEHRDTIGAADAHRIFTNLYSAQKQYQTAEKHLKQSQTLYQQKHNANGVAACFLQQAVILQNQKKFYSSEYFAKKAVDFYVSINNKIGLKDAYPIIIKSYIGQKKLRLAQDLASYLLEDALDKKEKALQVTTLDLLSDIYYLQGKYKKAYDTNKHYHILKDSLLNLKSIQNVQNIQTSYLLEEQEKNLAEQMRKKEYESAKKRFILWFMLLLTSALGAFGILVYRNRMQSIKDKARKEQKENQRKTEELQAFNYTVSHDLKAPLTNAEHFITLIEARQNRQEDFGEYLTHFKKLIADMRQMIDGIGAYSQADGVVLSLQPIDTNALLSYVVEHLAPLYPHAPTAVQWETLPPLHGDPLLLRQVLTNLIENALKFTQNIPNPAIRITGQRTSQSVHFQIQDNGIGFAPQAAERIFSLFHSAHPKGISKGSGIGLAIVKRIIERHKGKVWAESQGVGKGATFFLNLPVQENNI